MKNGIVVLLLAGVLGACTDGPAVLAGGPASEVQVSATQARAMDNLGRGIALAFADANVRRVVLEAMHRSKKPRHKLVLQDFAEGPGAMVIAAAATHLGTTEARLRTVLRELPTLELYLPLSRHRKAWHGGPDIGVGVATAKGAPSLRIIGVDGNETILKRGVRAGDVPFMIIRPSNLIPAGVVASAGAASRDECPPEAIECDPGDPTGGLPTPGVYIDRFFPGQDDGVFGGVEVRFLFYDVYAGQGSPIEVRRDVDPYEWHNEDILVKDRSCSGPPSFNVIITEIDGQLNGGNEDWGHLYYPPRVYDVDKESWMGGNFMIALRMTCK